MPGLIYLGTQRKSNVQIPLPGRAPFLRVRRRHNASNLRFHTWLCGSQPLIRQVRRAPLIISLQKEIPATGRPAAATVEKLPGFALPPGPSHALGIYLCISASTAAPRAPRPCSSTHKDRLSAVATRRIASSNAPPARASRSPPGGSKPCARPSRRRSRNIQGQRSDPSASPASSTALSCSTSDGQVIRPAKLWNDTETAPENQQLVELLGGKQAWFDRFGIVPLTGYTVSKLLWLQEHEPENFARIRAHSAAARVPQLLAHWPRRRRVRRRLRHRVLRHPHSPVDARGSGRNRRRHRPAVRRAPSAHLRRRARRHAPSRRSRPNSACPPTVSSQPAAATT